MHFSAVYMMLSGWAMLSTSTAAPNSIVARADGTATFQTFTVPTCDREEGTVRYQDVTTGACRPLTGGPVQSIRVYFASNQANCRINTFSGAGCTGDLTPYRFESFDAPCRLISNKLSYNVTC
ncbi:hypothetical protein DE146DRAFT_668847 [Phaeosphaeria sp. MPI-PUGE-AT-0046c]|nr:hypothetical protein DE146DRAFT_668847 [Phaeosphaeria sp. MPI-PUGE-AT-0046c]